jgi:putative transposase
LAVLAGTSGHGCGCIDMMTRFCDREQEHGKTTGRNADDDPHHPRCLVEEPTLPRNKPTESKWQADGSTESMHDQLRDRIRELAGRKRLPFAAIIDSQSVRAAEEVARTSRGYDAGKKVAGRKRHIAVDVMGLLLTVLVTAASVQDRDAAKPLLWNLRKAFPSVRLAWADGGYAGKLIPWAKAALKLTVQIVRRPDDLHTFQVLPRRWVVERTLAWITRHRRTVRDYERLPAHHETYIYWSMIMVMSRRLARKAASSSAPAESDAA